MLDLLRGSKDKDPALCHKPLNAEAYALEEAQLLKP